MRPLQPEPGLPVSRESADELVRAVVRLVKEQGADRSYDGVEIRELLSVNAVLTNPRARLFSSTDHPEIFNPGLAVARFFYLLSGDNDIDSIAFYSRAARRFSHDELTMPGGAHGFRLFHPTPARDQIAELVRLLRAEPERNRGAVAVYYPDDCGSEFIDLTCVMGALFTKKEGRLQSLVNMRANDALRLMWHDLFEFSMLGEYLAGLCGLELGSYYHSSFVMMLIGERALEIADPVVEERGQAPEMPAMPPVEDGTRTRLVKLERQLRERIAGAEFDDFRRALDSVSGEEPYWADLLTTLALQGRYANSDPETTLAELPTLDLPLEFVVTGEAALASERIASTRLAGLAGGGER